MSNEWIWILFAIINFSLLLIMYRLFGKIGLFSWIAFSTVVANVQVVKTIELFGMVVTLGNIMYGTTFLATDILNEKYGKEHARKAVWLGFFTLLTVTILMQFALLFTPHDVDFAHDALETIFGLMPRIALGSLSAFLISQLIDVHIYSFLRRIFPNDHLLWIRNNGSTLISQLVDTSLFCVIAFWGVYSTDVWIDIFITTYILKSIISLIDTPFMYAAKKIGHTIKTKEH